MGAESAPTFTIWGRKAPPYIINDGFKGKIPCYYESYIKEQPNWLFAGVYVDYGSRVRIDKRAVFQKMIQKAVNGEIDCIITKSISRFSGNTVDMLQTIQLLKEKGVTVWFEKENIRSTGENMELAITIHGLQRQRE